MAAKPTEEEITRYAFTPYHLEKLKNEDLVKVRREGTYLWLFAAVSQARPLIPTFSG